MMNRKFEAWCDAATAKIRYGGDRNAVSAELRGHLEDRYDAYLTAGLSQAEATEKTLKAMGDAQEIAPQLGAIHRPWLGYLYSFLKFVGITSSILAAFFIGMHLWTAGWNHARSVRFESLPANVENISFYCKPNLSAEVEGYHISIQEAAVAEVEGDLRFYFEMEVRWWPWMNSFSATEDFWAVDSLGNYYHPYSAAAFDLPRVIRGGSSSTSGIYNATMALTLFDADAQWVEIRYDRDGRDLVFRIDLTGGGNHG